MSLADRYVNKKPRRRRFRWRFWEWVKERDAAKVVQLIPRPRKPSRFGPPPAGELVIGCFRMGGAIAMPGQRPRPTRRTARRFVQLDLFDRPEEGRR